MQLITECITDHYGKYR